MFDRILFCGSRHWNDKVMVKDMLRKLCPKTLIVGCAEGADALAEEAANEINAEGKIHIEILALPAHWKQEGNLAGPLRNKRMLDIGEPQLVVAFHNNLAESKGTKNMLTQARKRHITIMTLSHGTATLKEAF